MAQLDASLRYTLAKLGPHLAVQRRPHALLNMTTGSSRIKRGNCSNSVRINLTGMIFSTSSALRLATLILLATEMTALGATVHVDENRYALLENQSVTM